MDIRKYGTIQGDEGIPIFYKYICVKSYFLVKAKCYNKVKERKNNKSFKKKGKKKNTKKGCGGYHITIIY